MEKTINIGSEAGIGEKITDFFDQSQNWAALSLGSFLLAGPSPYIRNLDGFLQSLLLEPTHSTYLNAGLELYLHENSLAEIGIFLFGLYCFTVFVVLYALEKIPVSVSSADANTKTGDTE